MKTTLITLVLILIASTGIHAQQPPTQYVIPRTNNQLVTPAVATQMQEVTVSILPYYAPKKTKLQTMRETFGGSIPHVVITSDRENFVIQSEEGDILVVGHQHPHRVMVTPQQYTITSTELGAAIELRSSVVSIVEQTDKLLISPELPAWLPSDLLKSRTNYSAAEVVFSPNQRLAYPTGGTVEIAGVTYKKYQFVIKN